MLGDETIVELSIKWQSGREYPVEVLCKNAAGYTLRIGFSHFKAALSFVNRHSLSEIRELLRTDT